MSIPVDPRYTLVASGNVTPVPEWGEGEGGKRLRLDTQAVSADGVPLWHVEVLRQVSQFGEEKTAAVPVSVASRTVPTPQAFTPVGFEGLEVDFFVRKGGQLGERWSATGMLDPDALEELLSDDA